MQNFKYEIGDIFYTSDIGLYSDPTPGIWHIIKIDSTPFEIMYIIKHGIMEKKVTYKQLESMQQVIFSDDKSNLCNIPEIFRTYNGDLISLDRISSITISLDESGNPKQHIKMDGSLGIKGNKKKEKIMAVDYYNEEVPVLIRAWTLYHLNKNFGQQEQKSTSAGKSDE